MRAAQFLTVYNKELKDTFLLNDVLTCSVYIDTFKGINKMNKLALSTK